MSKVLSLAVPVDKEVAVWPPIVKSLAEKEESSISSSNTIVAVSTAPSESVSLVVMLVTVGGVISITKLVSVE